MPPSPKDDSPMILARGFLLALLGTLVACGAPQPPPKPKPIGTIDGLYRGTSTRFIAQDRSCPHPGLVRFDVMNGFFHYRLNGPIAVDARIDPDGNVAGDASGYTLRGDWDGQKIEGDVVSVFCALHFRALKQN
jgi:hypothetical protein